MYNKQIIIGNLGADPDLRTTSAGKQVAEFRVATSYGHGDNKVTEWFRVIAWDKLAENASKFLKKGSKAYIEGRTQTRTYTDKDGAQKYMTEVIANEVRFLDPANKDEADKKPAGRSRVEESADDIPF